jgi:hypothetical protein
LRCVKKLKMPVICNYNYSTMSDHFFNTISGNASMLPLNKEFDDVTAKFRKSIGTENVCVSVIYKINNDILNKVFDARARYGL